MSERGWTQEAFSERLRDIADSPARPAPSKEVNPSIEGFRRTAAVMSSFEPTKIRPFGDVGRYPGDFAVVLDDSEPVAGGSGTEWTLRPEIRARTLRGLVDQGILVEVVASTQAPDDDPVNRVLREITMGELGDLEDLSEIELTAALELVKGVGGSLPGIPSVQTLSRILGRKRLFAPFRHLADPEHFRGREGELETLRNYVGVADPKTTTGSIFRHVRDFFGFEKRPPLMIFGPGGMGKSALLSHFILEHAELDPEQRFPFAYLDFDRPSVTAREPLTIIGEILTQMGIQYPAVADWCEQLRRDLLPHLGWAFADTDIAAEQNSPNLESVGSARGTSSSDYERERFVDELSELFTKIAPNNQPLLLVLDTFEEIQHYSRADIPDLISFLEQVQRAIPRLRVVLAGRARESSVRIEPLVLEPLRAADAAEVLASYDVDKKTAKLIASKLGGNPLTLRLAIDVYLRDGLTGEDLADITRRDWFWKNVDEERIQGELYRRFLLHITDKEVRKIAHPGLVLRRVTPDVIYNVLREPCELQLGTPEDARVLFERLATEDTLVSWEGSAIVHRSDVRRIMITLLAEDKGDQVRAIHENAVAHYEPFDDVISRAEEIYHRYCLDQDPREIDGRWLEGIGDRLRAAVDEIPERLQSHLASLTGAETLDDEHWEGADTPDWERHVARRARKLISHARFEDALELMRARPWGQWTDASPLFNLQVVALAQLGELQKAYSMGLEAQQRMLNAGDPQQEMDLLASLGSVARRTGRPDEAIVHLEQAAEVAESCVEPLRAVDLRILALETSAWSQRSPEAVAEARDQLARLIAEIEPRQLVSAPVLFAQAARELASSHPSVAGRLNEILSGPEPTARPPEVGTADSWTGERLAQLNDSLLEVLSGTDQVEEILQTRLGVPLRELTAGGSLQSTLFELITRMQRQGRLDDFVHAVADEFPEAESIQELDAG